MAHIPDQVVNKSAKATQTVLFWIAAIAGLGGVAALSNGSGGGLIFLLIAIGVGWVAAKIKTTYALKGHGGVYK
jgi:hypothetical protein